jgi:hypothetical protein
LFYLVRTIVVSLAAGDDRGKGFATRSVVTHVPVRTFADHGPEEKGMMIIFWHLLLYLFLFLTLTPFPTLTFVSLVLFLFLILQQLRFL